MTTPDPETKLILNAAKDTHHANIITDLVGHPQSMPTREELEHMNPSIGLAALSEHLDTLQDAGVVQVVEANQHEFYHLTQHAREVFDENNLFEEDVCQAAYEEVSIPPEIQALEDLDRPAGMHEVEEDSVSHR